MGLELTVIICTHNPRPDYLDRVLAALRQQTLPKDHWELLVIDNASDRVLASEWDLSWHPQARHIREDELGLTPARLRGIAEARGDVFVFVDDDNLLHQNYLEKALQIAEDHPFIGAWGGTIRGEFEIEPEERTRPLLGYLALREFSDPLWSNIPGNLSAYPSGAGLCVRAAVAREYVRQVSADPRRRKLGRVGELLSSGEDYDLIETGCDLGMGFGNFPGLVMTHLIPRHRLQLDYLIRLMQGCTASGVMSQYLRSGIVPPEPSRLRVTARFLFKYLTESRHQARIFRAQKAALRAGIQAVHELPAHREPVPSGDAPPYLSVVIPTYQRSTRVAECLEHLADCIGARNVEVIVVDQTPIAPLSAPKIDPDAAFFRFEQIIMSVPNVAAARNCGAMAAAAPIILFVDDDVALEKSYLANLLALFAAEPVDVLAGKCMPGFATPAELSVGLEVAEWLPTHNFAIRRKDFIAVGGFDENLYRYNEDAELSHRLSSCRAKPRHPWFAQGDPSSGGNRWNSPPCFNMGSDAGRHEKRPLFLVCGPG